MKKLLATMLTFLACGAAYALPCGNPADPALLTTGLFWDECYDDYEESCDPCYDPCGWDWDISLRIGYYGDFVFNRDLEIRSHGNGDIDHSTIWTNAGLIVLNFWERFDVYTTLGASRFNLESHPSNFGIISLGRVEVETDTQFSWSVGARAIIWECGCTYLGLDARYFRSRPDVRRIVVADSVTVNPDDLELKYHEWQVDLAIAHRINVFVPYFAVKWSKFHGSFDGEGIATYFPNPNGFRNRQQWGYAVGVSLVDCDIMSLNVEGRFRDEKAVAVNAQIRL